MSKAKRLLEEDERDTIFMVPDTFTEKQKLIEDILQRNQGNIDVVYMTQLLQDAINNPDDWKGDIGDSGLRDYDEPDDMDVDMEDIEREMDFEDGVPD